MTTEHTVIARRMLGPDALVVPELKVVWKPRPSGPIPSRLIIWVHISVCRTTPITVCGWGFARGTFVGGGSDRLIDALVAWGSADAVAERVRAHLDAGANHVCLHLVDDRDPVALVAAWRTLAPIVLG